jgi:hypothetical protein
MTKNNQSIICISLSLVLNSQKSSGCIRICGCWSIIGLAVASNWHISSQYYFCSCCLLHRPKVQFPFVPERSILVYGYSKNMLHSININKTLKTRSYHVNFQGFSGVEPLSTKITMYWSFAAMRIKMSLQTSRSDERHSAQMAHVGSHTRVDFHMSIQHCITFEFFVTNFAFQNLQI